MGKHGGAPGGPGGPSLESEPLGMAKPHCRDLCSKPWLALVLGPYGATGGLPSLSSGLHLGQEGAPAVLARCPQCVLPPLRSTNGCPRPKEAAAM